ncbi:MAG: nucleotidyl transferase AbiEii/AbiGii toxin family protein, partial [Candidatus Obscuribacterales bacterium]|nr:nucleotidyl transferase AbiEii/AbiGii toxin family protein [Candidatus Obscuribacterales bacterium]
PLPRTSNTIKVDITLSEKLTFQLEDRFVLTSYIEFDDLPEDASIKAYSLKEIATEKVVAILDRRRSEPRDIYDFWYLTRSQYVDCLDLVPAIEEKLTFRGLKLVDEAKNFDSGKEAKYRKAWKQRLEQQMSQLPEFESVNRAVQREFRRVHILGN